MDGFYESLEPCVCTVKRQHQAILQNSGIAAGFSSKSFDNYETKGKAEAIVRAHKLAIRYVSEYKAIRRERNNSIAFLGAVGSGKTHLSIAVANELLNQGIPVKYMEYRKDIDDIKRNRLDDAYYYKQIMRYKNVEVLLVDDLFKGAIKGGELNPSDLGIMFDILNHRYLENKAIIISSELTVRDLTDCDEAIGSRIVDMCRGRIAEMKGQGVNHRLRRG